jgi:alpha-ketoglutarate-dependent taurine dioxygenase
MSAVRYQRRAVAQDPLGLVRLSPLEGCRIPTLIEPVVAGLDLIGWAESARETIDTLFARHKALLFRGFARQDVERFADFVAATSSGPPLEYIDRTTPRTRLADGVYSSTIYPARHTIEQHSEGTYWQSWPARLYFACAIASATGGETPLTDNAAVLARLPATLRADFEAKGFTLKRNFNKGFGLSWQDSFQTSDPAVVEAYCRSHDIGFAWRGGGALATWQTRPAVRRHPRTGADLWFSHAAFFHASAYDREVMDGLIDACGADELPYDTSFGDGTPIPVEAIETIRAAIAAETDRFAWREGDMLIVDNMALGHGRAPYTGERRILVAMTEPLCDGDSGGD